MHQSLFPDVLKVLVAFIFKRSSSVTHFTERSCVRSQKAGILEAYLDLFYLS